MQDSFLRDNSYEGTLYFLSFFILFKRVVEIKRRTVFNVRRQLLFKAGAGGSVIMQVSGTLFELDLATTAAAVRAKTAVTRSISLIYFICAIIGGSARTA